MRRRTKIIATIGPASISYEVLSGMVERGVDYVIKIIINVKNCV